ncbi:MAG: hypothetical protein ACRDQ7_08985 [Haloechinothrix sp.]
MNSMPGGGPDWLDQQIRPGRVWYWVAGGILLLGLLAAGTVGWRAASSFPSPAAELRALEFKTVTLDDEGMTIYATEGSFSGSCQVRDAAGDRVQLSPPSGTETVTINNRRWSVIARTPDPVPAGDYVVGCESADDATVFGVGPHSSVLGTIGVIFAATGIAVLSFLIAGVVALVVFLRRRSARQRLHAGGGYGPGYTPPAQY